MRRRVTSLKKLLDMVLLLFSLIQGEFWCCLYRHLFNSHCSPRGANAEGENDSYDFGTGAGFYVDATTERFSKHYNMYTYITNELPSKLKQSGLPLNVDNASIMGHSMGGHGALTIYLREFGKYKSCSGFSSILNPTQCPWGQKAFNGYLGNVEAGLDHDSTELIKKSKGKDVKILLVQVCLIIF